MNLIYLEFILMISFYISYLSYFSRLKVALIIQNLILYFQVNVIKIIILSLIILTFHSLAKKKKQKLI